MKCWVERHAVRWSEVGGGGGRDHCLPTWNRKGGGEWVRVRAWEGEGEGGGRSGRQGSRAKRIWNCP